MTIRVTRNYGNGFTATIEGAKGTDLVRQMSIADELFMDIRCAAEVDGQRLVSDQVAFQFREAGGYSFYEQVCVDSTPEAHKLKYYKRELGQSKDRAQEGYLYVKRKPELNANEVPGYAGWKKYSNPNGGGGYAPQQQQQPQPQQQAPPPPPPQQQAPPPQQQPQPYATNTQSASSTGYDDDIPF